MISHRYTNRLFLESSRPNHNIVQQYQKLQLHSNTLYKNDTEPHSTDMRMAYFQKLRTESDIFICNLDSEQHPNDMQMGCV